MKGHPDDTALVDFAAGGLSAPERMKLAAHLEGCARCKGVMSSLSDDTSPSGRRLHPDASLERTQSSDPLIGRMLGEYKVLQRLGQGGMGVLYRGEQPVIGKEVAIKVLLQTIAADAVLVQRMIGEARAVNAVRHPNIVDIFSFGQLPDGRPYMVMELLEGQSLAELLSAVQRLTVAQGVVVLGQAMAALEAAHAAGVIHRDLKPDNIFVDLRPEGWRVTLIDFGLAKTEGSNARGLTRPGMVVGTPGYMAPEQVRGEAGVSAKTDIYAMGVVAWTLLAGREPFGGGSAVEIMHRHLKTPAPPLPPEVAGDVPAALQALVLQMLQKDPAQRPSATEVRAALARLDVSVPAPAPAPARPDARRGLPVLLVAAVVLVGLGLAAAGWWVNLEAAAPPSVVPAPRPLDLVVPIAKPEPLTQPPSELVPLRAPPAMSTRVRWRCASVIEVSEVMAVLNTQWAFFTLTIADEPRVLVTGSGTKKGLKDLRQRARAIRACRDSTKVLTAERSNPSHEGLMSPNGFFYRGVEVVAADLSIGPAGPSN